jgi:hypothetical protein
MGGNCVILELGCIAMAPLFWTSCICPCGMRHDMLLRAAETNGLLHSYAKRTARIRAKLERHLNARLRSAH